MIKLTALIVKPETRLVSRMRSCVSPDHETIRLWII
jgi:hypothetical protein